MLDEMYKEVRELQEILGYNDPKRIAQEQRLKFLMDRIAIIEYAKEEAEKKAFEEGKRERALRAAKIMKLDNYPIADIAYYTDLSEEEIEKIK